MPGAVIVISSPEEILASIIAESDIEYSALEGIQYEYNKNSLHVTFSFAIGNWVVNEKINRILDFVPIYKKKATINIVDICLDINEILCGQLLEKSEKISIRYPWGIDAISLTLQKGGEYKFRLCAEDNELLVMAKSVKILENRQSEIAVMRRQYCEN